MLIYIRSFAPQGTNLSTVQLHMSIAHGLTFRKTQEYVYEMQMGGLLSFEGGKIKLRMDRFLHLMKAMGKEHLFNVEE